MLKLRKNKKGFTLVELIVVIAIMAVLAGTIAGVTVSQLNKQTDRSGDTQAKLIADYVVQELGANRDNVLDETGTTAKFKSDIKTTIETNMKNDKIPFGDGKGKINVTVADASVTIVYKGKASGAKNITYVVDTEGKITRTEA